MKTFRHLLAVLSIGLLAGTTACKKDSFTPLTTQVVVRGLCARGAAAA